MNDAPPHIREHLERLATAEAAIARVRAIHAASPARFSNGETHDLCEVCSYDPPDIVMWPCPTIQALDVGEERP